MLTEKKSWKWWYSDNNKNKNKKFQSPWRAVPVCRRKDAIALVFLFLFLGGKGGGGGGGQALALVESFPFLPQIGEHNYCSAYSRIELKRKWEYHCPLLALANCSLCVSTHLNWKRIDLIKKFRICMRWESLIWIVNTIFCLRQKK